jgi:chromosome partitioning protein
MRTIAITNFKGGSAKSTTAVNLAAALGLEKKTVLVIDIDPQASATSWLGIENRDPGTLAVLRQRAPIIEAIQPTQTEGVSIISAGSGLAQLPEIAAEDEKLSLRKNELLKRAIAKLPGERFDYCLIDCPPSLALMSKNALVAADSVLIPCEARFMALEGLAQLLDTLEVIAGEDGLNPELVIEGVLACRVDQRRKHDREVLAALQTRFKKDLFSTVIRENVRLAEAPSFSKSIFDYDERSAGAEDYRSLARELVKRNTQSLRRVGNG